MAALTLYLLIFFASRLFSMLGLGGGAIYTPIQVWFGIDFHVAATTSLFLIMCTSLSATFVFHKAQKIDWPLAFAIETTTALGSFLGGYYSGLFSSHLLSLLFSGTITIVGLTMLSGVEPPKVHPHSSKWYIWHRPSYSVNLPIALMIGFMAGAFSGLLGIGGGILKVPLLVLLLGVPMDIAVGTSAFMVGITALGGFTGHYLQGHWDSSSALIMACFVLLGAQIGSKRSLATSKKQLRKGCGILLLIIALTMLFV